MAERKTNKKGGNVGSLKNDISPHFKKRCHRRTGLGKKGMDKFIEKAKKYGLYEPDITNIKLKHFIMDKVDDCGNTRNFIIYNRYILIFTRNVYITILHLPNEYCKIAYSLQKQKYEKINNKGDENNDRCRF